MLKYIYGLFNKSMKIKLLLLFIIIIIGSMLSMYPIVLIRNIVDLAVSGATQNIKPIIRVGIAYLVIQVFSAALIASINFLSKTLQAEISYKGQVQLFDNLNKIKIESIKSLNSSHLSNSLIQDTEYMSKNIVEPFIDLITSVLMFIFGFYYMSKINILITLLILPLGLITSLVCKNVDFKSRKNIEKQRQLSSSLWKIYSEGIWGFISIRLHNYYKKYREKICSNGSELKENQIYQSKIEGYSYFFTSSLFMITIGLILIVASIFVIKNKVTIGGLTAILMYNHMITDPLLKMLEIHQKIIKLKISVNRIISINSLSKEENIEKYSDVDEINIKNVCYTIENQVILDNVNLNIKSPMSMAIFGVTGSGKSTLTNLISGIYSPSIGTIEYKKYDLLVPYKSKVSYMLQDEFLFDDSIITNIIIGNPNISEMKLKEIISLCELNELIDVHGNKAIGENGSNLSGGERKRVQLARTLANDKSDIYIFDELSSSLDRETFYRIYGKVEKLLLSKIRIYIEHNIEIGDKVDCVVYVNEHTCEVKSKIF